MTSAKASQSITIDPSQIKDDSLSIDLSRLSIKTTDPESPTRHMTLPLLQPLARPPMLAACRNPSSTTVRFPDGRASDGIGPEILDLTALDRAWRKLIFQLPPASSITFDLSLPKPEQDGSNSSDGFQKIHWDTSVPSRGEHIAVSGRDVLRLAVTIATTTRVREQGENVRFNVTHDEADGASARAIGLLKTQLDAIAQHPSPRATGSQQAVAF